MAFGCVWSPTHVDQSAPHVTPAQSWTPRACVAWPTAFLRPHFIDFHPFILSNCKGAKLRDRAVAFHPPIMAATVPGQHHTQVAVSNISNVSSDAFVGCDLC